MIIIFTFCRLNCTPTNYSRIIKFRFWLHRLEPITHLLLSLLPTKISRSGIDFPTFCNYFRLPTTTLFRIPPYRTRLKLICYIISRFQWSILFMGWMGYHIIKQKHYLHQLHKNRRNELKKIESFSNL